VAGAISGNVEMIDFDCAAEAYATWRELVDIEVPGLTTRLLLERSQSGGKHVVYRSASCVPGSTVLARKRIVTADDSPSTYCGKEYLPHKADGKWQIEPVLIETRGEGGIFLCAPSPGYMLEQRTFDDLPVVSDAERQAMVRAAESLDELPKRLLCPCPSSVEASRPGDEFNERGDIRPVLRRHGWHLVRPGHNEHWRRPRKDRGWSATFNGEVFFVFTSNAPPLELKKGYSKFGVYALLEHGGDFAAAAKALAEQGYGTGKSDRKDGAAHGEQSGRPTVLLPGRSVSISESADKLGQLLARSGLYFVRGGTSVALGTDVEGLPILRPVAPASLASILESVARLQRLEKVKGQVAEVAATCTEQTAKLILHAEAFLNALPPIDILTRCPVLIERDGELVQVCGYDHESGIMAAGEPAEEVCLMEARRLLWEMLGDFKFAAEADRARALAAIITPALVFGGLLPGRAPVDLGEADASQTGKGYRNKLTAAVYRQTVRTIAQRRRGVGSMEESFNAALVRGANFISLDNVRGKVNSPALESFATEDRYLARCAYRADVEIDPQRVVIQMTSNKADITTDLANRCSCVNLYRQKEGYQFRAYPEGDILDHVRAHQLRYLGAVFAVIRAWHETGKLRTQETRHDFRPWAQTLDWIVQNLLGTAPLMDGHRQTQIRMTRPGLNWLRDVAFAVRREGLMGRELRTRDLVEIIAEDGDIEVPGLSDGEDLAGDDVRKRALQATGRRLARCFKAGDTVALEGLRVIRQIVTDTTQWKDSKVYRILAAEGTETDPPMRNPGNAALGGSMGGSATDSRLTAHTACGSEHSESTAGSSPAYAPAYAPNMDPPIKTQHPPNPPEGPPMSMYGDDIERGAHNNAPIPIYSSSPPGGIGGTGGQGRREAQLDPDDEGVLI
jgi:hypothetical protein